MPENKVGGTAWEVDFFCRDGILQHQKISLAFDARASGGPPTSGLPTIHPVSNLNSIQDAERSQNRSIRGIQFRLAFVAQREYIRLIQ